MRKSTFWIFVIHSMQKQHTFHINYFYIFFTYLHTFIFIKKGIFCYGTTSCYMKQRSTCYHTRNKTAILTSKRKAQCISNISAQYNSCYTLQALLYLQLDIQKKSNMTSNKLWHLNNQQPMNGKHPLARNQIKGNSCFIINRIHILSQNTNQHTAVVAMIGGKISSYSTKQNGKMNYNLICFIFSPLGNREFYFETFQHHFLLNPWFY